MDEGDRDAPFESVALSEREALALALAAEAAEGTLRATPLADALASARAKLLGSVTVYTSESAVLLAPGHAAQATSASVRPEVFDGVRRAVQERRSLTISYVDAQGQRTWGRVIDPHLLAVVAGSWVVVARDHRQGQVVHFSLSTIEEAAVGEPFAAPDALAARVTGDAPASDVGRR